MWRRPCARWGLVALVGALFCSGTLTAVPAGAGPTPAGPTPAQTASTAAVDWLVSQQQPDGGFELAGFPGFETPDVVLAIAMAAQTGPTWSTAEALAAVEAVEFGGSGGPTPLDALDAWVAGGIVAGQAAKLILLVVAPLGLDPADFGDSHTDLTALIYPTGCGGGADLTGVLYYSTQTMGLVGEILCGAPDPAIVARVRAAQRADGSWNFTGDPAEPTDNGDEIDVTSIALQVLIAAGASWDDPAVHHGLAWMASRQFPTGAFDGFGLPDPNSTAMAMLAVTAAGFDPTTSCWRDTVAPVRMGAPYGDPQAWLLAQQQPDGRVVSPNDTYGVNTFATAQSVEGWLRTWVPLVRATGAPVCAPLPAPDPEPRFTG